MYHKRPEATKGMFPSVSAGDCPAKTVAIAFSGKRCYDIEVRGWPESVVSAMRAVTVIIMIHRKVLI